MKDTEKLLLSAEVIEKIRAKVEAGAFKSLVEAVEACVQYYLERLRNDE